MHRTRFLMLPVICAALSSFMLSAPCLSSPDVVLGGRVITPLKPVLGTFRVSKTPVLLPTFILPQWRESPVIISTGPFKDGYEYALGTCNADTVLFGSGGIGTAQKSKRRVQLAPGREASFVQMRNDLCLEWQEGKYCYRLGVPANPKNEPHLIKVGKSLMLFPLSVLKDAPRGDDSLAKAVASDREIHESSKRMELGQKHRQALDAASRGNYKKAESLYSELLSNYQECEEIPPMHEIQLGLALVLSKSGRESEARKIKEQYASEIANDEKRRQKKIEEAQAQLDKTGKDAAYSSARVFLGNIRGSLARLYVVEGKTDKAETLFKEAFQDIATAYGRGASDAVSISDDYALMLRLAGKSEEPAKQLLKSSRKGHSAVTLKLSSAPGFKKMGADEVLIVVEDEYGAPSGDQWFTKKVWLQGMKGDKILWKKPIKVNDFINMDKCSASCDGSTFTIATTLGFLDCTHKFAWDGNKVTLKESKSKQVRGPKS